MPELPEVETIARGLRPHLTGQRLVGAQVLWSKTLSTPTPAEFLEQIQDQQILEVKRRAKFLILQLSGTSLLFHLRMSGDLTIQDEAYETQKHDRLILDLENGHKLVFNDTRKFGRVWLTNHPEDVLGHLGPEPLEPQFNHRELHARLLKFHRQMKPLLLDQRFVAGLGNIYTDEALHLSDIHPLRISDTITAEEAQHLHTAIQNVLLSGIEHNGASFDWVYRGGNFQNYFRVYGREGQPCPRCGTPIQRIVVGQRGTHFCPVCQGE
jgi:formamidopyrimidine-DNA glycosylase